MKRISISKVLTLREKKKFEVTCASFDAADHIFKVDVSKSLKNRKSAVQAIALLADEQLKYGYDEYQLKRNQPKSDENENEESDVSNNTTKQTDKTSQKELALKKISP